MGTLHFQCTWCVSACETCCCCYLEEYAHSLISPGCLCKCYMRVHAGSASLLVEVDRGCEEVSRVSYFLRVIISTLRPESTFHPTYSCLHADGERKWEEMREKWKENDRNNTSGVRGFFSPPPEKLRFHRFGFPSSGRPEWLLLFMRVDIINYL